MFSYQTITIFFQSKISFQNIIVPNQSDDKFIIQQRYQILKGVGHGSHGKVFICKDLYQNTLLAMKVEELQNNKRCKLQNEAKILQILNQNNFKGFTKLHKMYIDMKQQRGFIVIDLVGPSIQQILSSAKLIPCQSDVIKFAIQAIKLIKHVHDIGYIYKDMKLANFCMSLNKANEIFLIDFGISGPYIIDGKHITNERKHTKVAGTIYYNSINTHLLNEWSRRDDMEALGYCLSYMLFGYLPWTTINAKSKDELREKILELKYQTPIEQLFQGFNQAFYNYFNAVKQLTFYERPNYELYIQWFQQALSELGQSEDEPFQWYQNQKVQQLLSRFTVDDFGI